MLRDALAGDCCARGVSGLTHQSLEGAEARQVAYDEEYTALPQRDLFSEVLSQIHQGFLVKVFLARRMVLRSTFGLEDFDSEHHRDSRSLCGDRERRRSVSLRPSMRSWYTVQEHRSSKDGTDGTPPTHRLFTGLPQICRRRNLRHLQTC